jgi:hypothetical protein
MVHWRGNANRAWGGDKSPKSIMVLKKALVHAAVMQDS